MFTNPNVLFMTLKRKWFDEIRWGRKKQEYRELKRHWISRLKNPDNTWKSFEKVRFVNGYSRSSHWIDVEFKGCHLGKCEHFPGQCIVIELGKILDGSLPYKGDPDIYKWGSPEEIQEYESNVLLCADKADIKTPKGESI